MGGDDSATECGGVYAVGDVIGKIDLTPVAIAAGRLLSDRLFNGVPLEETLMDYDMVPTAVFSHPPLAVMGLTEAQAIERHGAEHVTTHTTTFVNMLYSREFLFDGPTSTQPWPSTPPPRRSSSPSRRGKPSTASRRTRPSRESASGTPSHARRFGRRAREFVTEFVIVAAMGLPVFLGGPAADPSCHSPRLSLGYVAASHLP